MEQTHALKKRARIWIFDGGGPSVISQLLIVNEIMHRIECDLKLDEVPRPCDYAELMVGSGLGAFVVILLARLRLTAEQALVHLIELGQTVFVESDVLEGGPRFDLEKLRASVSKILNQQQNGISDTSLMFEDNQSTEDHNQTDQTYAAITSLPTTNLSHCRFIRTYGTSKVDSNGPARKLQADETTHQDLHLPKTDYDFTIVEAVLAALAIPGWFNPVEIGPADFKESLISGAIAFGNPSLQAFDEAERIFGSGRNVSAILSFGSGRRSPRSLGNTISDNLKKVLNEMALNVEDTEEELKRRFENSNFYHRFSVDSGLENVPVAGWNETELGSINTHTKVYLQRVTSSLSAAVNLLTKNEGIVTLGQLSKVYVRPGTAKSLPRINPFFVTRTDVLGSMEQSLIHKVSTSQRIFVLYGMGGGGKTQMASFFATTYRDRYKYIFFVDASSAESIKMDLQSSIRSLGGHHSQDTYKEALEFLSHPDNRDWLVTFDNADNPRLPLTTYIPECEHGTLVITGRNDALTNLAPKANWHLQGMVESDSIRVLLRAARRETPGSEEESEAATELWNLLGGLPLALVHVGCYCAASKITFSQYLERFKEYRSGLMVMNPPLQLDDYSFSAYASIGLSYSQLDEIPRRLLHLLVFFHPSDIPLDILHVSSKYEFACPSILLPLEDEHSAQIQALRELLIPNGSWNDLRNDLLLNQLQSFSLITLSNSDGKRIISIHPLVQSCILDTLHSGPEEYDPWFKMAVLALSACTHAEETYLLQHLLPHVSQLESHKKTIHPDELAAFAHVHFSSGNHEDALSRWGIVKAQCEKRAGEKHISTYSVTSRIAVCLFTVHKYEEASEAIAGVVRGFEELAAEDNGDNPEYSRILEAYLSLLKTEQHALAVQLGSEDVDGSLGRILASHKSMPVSEDEPALLTRAQLISNLCIQGRYDEAEPLARSALPVMRKVMGDDHPLVLSVLHALSRCLQSRWRLAEVEEIAIELVSLYKTRYGKSHPETLMTMSGLALCLTVRGKELDKAEMLFREIIEGQERVLGKRHPNTLQSRRNLDKVLQMKGVETKSSDKVSFLRNLSQKLTKMFHWIITVCGGRKR